MKFKKFPNGKVWPVTEDNTVSGIVEAQPSDDFEAFLDNLSEAATGDICGISGISYESRGGDFHAFSGEITDFYADMEDLVDIDPNSDEFRSLLSLQYGLSEVEVAHAIGAIAANYGDECVVKIASSNRDLCAPAYPAECTYVRVVVGGFEIAYWNIDEVGEAPAEVLGAMIGALNARA